MCLKNDFYTFLFWGQVDNQIYWIFIIEAQCFKKMLIATVSDIIGTFISRFVSLNF